ncbi:MAG: sigma factor-like helix-turn-helix DNA-binding protein [Ilumatobacteraceae bacterium]
MEIVKVEADVSGATPSVEPTQTFEAFWTAHRASLSRALALTLGDSHFAAEAIDEAMARAFQRWSQVGQLDSPSGWVYRVGLNWSRSVLRRALRLPPSWMLSGSATPSDRYEPTIDAALAALPVSQRSVVVCRLLLGLSEAQTATALNIRPGTVKSRLSRAVDDLSVSLSHLDPSLEAKAAER